MYQNFYRFLPAACGILLSSHLAYGDASPQLQDAPAEGMLSNEKLISDADAEAKRKAQDKSFDSRIGKLESDMQKVKTETAYGNSGAKTAPANPQLDGYGFFATADFLWWKLYEGATEYVIKSKSIFPDPGTVEPFTFKWEPGFKVG